MATMSPLCQPARSGQTIVLLGRRNAGKTRLLTGVLRRDADALRTLSLHLPAAACVGFCSQKLLLHGHLTALENLQLAAAFAGVQDWRERLQQWLPETPWFLGNGRPVRGSAPAALLPRTELRLLALAAALLGDPQLLLIDDLGRGLSRPAQGDLWRLIKRLQQRKPRLIIYATRDLRAARSLGADVWLLEEGAVRARWGAGALPRALHTVEAFGFTMKRRQDVVELTGAMRALQPYHCAVRNDGLTVDVLTRNRQPTILELATIAGAGLARFAALQAEVDLLPAGWHTPAENEASTGEDGCAPAALAVEDRGVGPGRERHVWRVVRLLALAEWRRFFRVRARLVLPLVSNAVLLALLPLALSGGQQGMAGSLPLLLAIAAAPGLALSLGAALYWRHTAEMRTLFSQAGTSDKRQAPTLLALFELAGAPRSTLRAGLGLGALMILAAHSALFHVGWYLLLWQLNVSPVAALAGWLLPAVGFVALGLLALPAGRRKEKG